MKMNIEKFNRIPIKCLVALFLILITLITKPGQAFWFASNDNDDDNHNCIEDPLEIREQKSIVVISGKVLKKELDPNENHLEIAHVQIKRVFKGTDVVDAISDERPNVISDGSFNKVIPIYGIGEATICKSSVNKGDTRIFMLNLEYFGNLRISSSIIRISSYNLDRTDAAVRGTSLFSLL